MLISDPAAVTLSLRLSNDKSGLVTFMPHLSYVTGGGGELENECTDAHLMSSSSFFAIMSNLESLQLLNNVVN